MLCLLDRRVIVCDATLVLANRVPEREAHELAGILRSVGGERAPRGDHMLHLFDCRLEVVGAFQPVRRVVERISGLLHFAVGFVS